MKVGILGSGEAGCTLGRGLIRLGYSVMIGTRDPRKEKLQQWIQENRPAASLGTFAEAAASGDILFLCTSWSGTQAAIETAGVWNFRNKVVVDVTNPLDGKGPDHAGRLRLVTGNAASGGERVQRWLQDAHVVKAFNSTGSALMTDPAFDEGPPTMFIAGNDELAKKAVTDLLRHLGWKDVQDTGSIEMSRHLESLYVIWSAVGFRTGKWHHAFRLLRK